MPMSRPSRSPSFATFATGTDPSAGSPRHLFFLHRSGFDCQVLRLVGIVALLAVVSDFSASSLDTAAMALSGGGTASASRRRVSEFARLPFVRRALRQAFDGRDGVVSSPRPVLTFFYGVDCDRPDHVDAQLRQGGCLEFESMPALWYGGGPSYDRLCRVGYSHLVRRAGVRVGPGGLPDDVPAWHTTADGLAARLVLCDQLSRNCFRGTPEAYAFDGTARDLAHRLSYLALLPLGGTTEKTAPVTEAERNASSATAVVTGEVYPPYMASAVTALMHSEELQDHDAAARLLDRAVALAPSPRLRPWWDVQWAVAIEHRAVLEEFGRYPHRNAAFDRTSTPAELRWLASDQVPGWARSQ